MRDHEALLLGATLGGGLYLLTARRATAAPAPRANPTPAAVPPVASTPVPPAKVDARVFDLGRPVDRSTRAIITSGWSRPRKHGPHRAIDIPLPIGTPILAVDGGTVVHVQPHDRGDAGRWVAVRHPTGLTSRYLHLDRVLVAHGQQVRRGDVIGLSGDTGNSAAPHLHLDLRVPATSLPAIVAAIGSPRPGWGAPMRPFGHSIPGEPFVLVDGYRDDVRRDALAAGIPLRVVSAAAPASEPRNGRLTYRPVGRRGERYPAWLHALKGKSGVYVIRDRGVVAYVGQSSAGKLYETLTRHLQSWRRWKSFWSGQYAEGHDPGLTYDRDTAEVAVRVTSPDRALDEEARLIRRLRPRDNLLGQPQPEAEIPF